MRHRRGKLASLPVALLPPHDAPLPEPLRAMVCGSGLGAARASLALSRSGAGRALRAPDRADRRRKTLADPATLVELAERPTARGLSSSGLHTLYISPLKALAINVAAILSSPSPTWICRSGSRPAPATRQPRSAFASAAIHPTSCSPRREQIALLLSTADAHICSARLNANRARRAARAGDLEARRPALPSTSRGSAARPQATAIGLSATIAEPSDLCSAISCRSRRAASPPPTSSSPKAAPHHR